MTFLLQSLIGSSTDGATPVFAAKCATISAPTVTFRATARSRISALTSSTRERDQSDQRTAGIRRINLAKVDEITQFFARACRQVIDDAKYGIGTVQQAPEKIPPNKAAASRDQPSHVSAISPAAECDQRQSDRGAQEPGRASPR